MSRVILTSPPAARGGDSRMHISRARPASRCRVMGHSWGERNTELGDARRIAEEGNHGRDGRHGTIKSGTGVSVTLQRLAVNVKASSEAIYQTPAGSSGR